MSTTSSKAGERVEVSATFYPYDSKLYLNEDEPQVGQRDEDVERKWECYHIIISPLKGLKCYIKKEEDKWTPYWWNTSTAFSSTSPNLLARSIPINQWSGMLFSSIGHSVIISGISCFTVWHLDTSSKARLLILPISSSVPMVFNCHFKHLLQKIPI